MAPPSSFKQVFVNQDLTTVIKEVPAPELASDDILVRVIASGVNPKDWKCPELGMTDNSGDDIAGYVEAIGKDVREFRVGDRVAGFHVMTAPYGSFGEYGILKEHLTFHIPAHTSFVEASTIPLAALTAALGLFIELDLPTPWAPAPEGSSNPLIIWGASANVGAFGVKLAKAANISPLIAICGSGRSYVESLGVDKIFDYRDEDVVQQIKEYLGDQQCYNLLDAVGGEDNWKRMGELVEDCGTVASAMPGDEGVMKKLIGEKKNIRGTWCSRMQPPPEENPMASLSEWGTKLHFGYVMTKSIGKLLAEGRFSAHPQRVLEGLESVERALKELKEGKASAVKYVIKIGQE